MKKLLILVFVFVFSCVLVQGQTDTAVAAKQPAYMPNFRIQMADSSWFTKNDLAAKPTLILYFSPECGHCQIETDTLLSLIKSLKDLQVVMVTSRTTEEMKNFSDRFMLQKFASIKIGSDESRYVTQFYKVKFTPFSALYDKNGKLIKAYEDGIDFNELKALL